MTGRTKERIAQSKRARAGSLALVDYQVATSGVNLYPPGVWFADVMTSFSGVTFDLFCFFFVFMLSLMPRPFVQSSFDMQEGAPIATRVSFFLLPFFYLDMSLFPSIFCTIAFFSLYKEYLVRSFLPDGAFLPCDHGLGF